MKTVTTLVLEVDDIVRIKKPHAWAGKVAQVKSVYSPTRYQVMILDGGIDDVGVTTVVETEILTYIDPKDYVKNKIAIPFMYDEFEGISEEINFYPMAKIIEVGCQKFSYATAVDLAETFLKECKAPAKKTNKKRK